MQAPPDDATMRTNRWLAAWGGCLAAVGVALSAYAAHALGGHDQVRLQTAALFAFGHGVALACLARDRCSRLGRVALGALALGVLLFSGSLAAGAIAHWPTSLAPFGGMLMIGGWLAWLIDSLRR